MIKTTFFARIRQLAMLAALVLLAVMQASPASAVVRTTLSFFSPTQLSQGEIGAVGTANDPLGQVEPAGSFQCCFVVSAAQTTGAPFELRRTFSGLDVVNQLYYLGVSTVAGQNHLVLALNQAFSATLVGREFGTAFAGFSETQLIADLFAASDASLTNAQRATASDRRVQFGNKLFELNAGFGVNDSFALTSFSTGVPAGTGFSRITATAPVPEPATWAMTIFGFGLIGAVTRRTSRLSVLSN